MNTLFRSKIVGLVGYMLPPSLPFPFLPTRPPQSYLLRMLGEDGTMHELDVDLVDE